MLAQMINKRCKGYNIRRNPAICSGILEIKHDDIDNDDDGGIQSRRSLATCCSTLEIEYLCTCLLYYDASDDVEHEGGDGDQVDNDGGDGEEELLFALALWKLNAKLHCLPSFAS